MAHRAILGSVSFYVAFQDCLKMGPLHGILRSQIALLIASTLSLDPKVHQTRLLCSIILLFYISAIIERILVEFEYLVLHV